MVFANPAFMDQGIKGFLYLLRAGIQLIEKEDIGLLSCNHFGREKFAGFPTYTRYADDILRSKLASEKRDAGETDFVGKLFHNGGFPDSGRAPDKDRSGGRNI
jgi:hypothetical protein